MNERCAYLAGNTNSRTASIKRRSDGTTNDHSHRNAGQWLEHLAGERSTNDPPDRAPGLFIAGAALIYSGSCTYL